MYMGMINICITVDWEGEHLDNVYDLIKMREHFKCKVPLTHFICPNYFVQTQSQATNRHLIDQALQPTDEVALHIHCYKELIDHIGEINFKTEQNYHNPPNWFEEKFIKKIFPAYSRNISGRGVPLSVYSPKEIQAIVASCQELLKKNIGRDDIKGFRAGGWIANDDVLEIVSELGFRYDSSAVPPSILSSGYSRGHRGNKKDDYHDANGIFTEHIIKLWGYQKQENGFLKNTKILEANNGKAIQVTTQPFKFKNITMIPNNCALADFCSPSKTIIPLIKKTLYQSVIHPGNSYVLVFGCHQEGDYFYKEQLVRFVNSVIKMDSDKINFVNMRHIAARCKQPL